MTTLSVASALIEVEECDVLCATCENVAQEDERYCLSCKLYWDDCANGLWAKDSDDEIT